jgi:hypothetical protein
MYFFFISEVQGISSPSNQVQSYNVEGVSFTISWPGNDMAPWANDPTMAPQASGFDLSPPYPGYEMQATFLTCYNGETMCDQSNGMPDSVLFFLECPDCQDNGSGGDNGGD